MTSSRVAQGLSDVVASGIGAGAGTLMLTVIPKLELLIGRVKPSGGCWDSNTHTGHAPISNTPPFNPGGAPTPGLDEDVSRAMMHH